MDPESMVSNSEEKVHDFKHTKKVSNSERKRKGNFRGSKRLLCYADNPSFFFFVCGRFENPTQKETFTPTQFPKTRNSIEGMKLQNPV